LDVFLGLGGEFGLVGDGDSGGGKLGSDDGAFWVFLGSVGWGGDSSLALEDLHSLLVFVDLGFGGGEFTGFDGGSDGSDLGSEDVAFWVFGLG
jgi:hypothetical protein